MSDTDTDREKTWLSIQQAADHLGVNPRTVRRYMRLGRLEASRVSNKVVRIRLADLDRFLEDNLATPKLVHQAPQPAKPATFSPGNRPGTF